MNFRKMLECLVSYAKSDRAPELREAVQRLVNNEAARRKRTAARLWVLRTQLREARRDSGHYPAYWRCDTMDRRNAVRAVEK